MKLKASKPVTLKLPPFQRVCITLAGCGGTGSHLASGLAALALELIGRNVHTSMYFIDPDRVEEKNVGRQLFASRNIGQAKASVLADRIMQSYPFAPAYSVRSIDGQDSFLDDKSLSLVIGAVDNAPARAVIAKAVERAKGRLWWLDTGNENCSGQIALGNSADPAKWRPALGMVDSLPAPHLVYPDLVKARKPKRVSCADAAEQGLMVNRMAAAWALAMLSDFLLGSLRYFSADFDLAFGGVRARALDEETLKEIAK